MSFVLIGIGIVGVCAILAVGMLSGSDAQIVVAARVMRKKGYAVPDWMTPFHFLSSSCGCVSACVMGSRGGRGGGRARRGPRLRARRLPPERFSEPLWAFPWRPAGIHGRCGD